MTSETDDQELSLQMSRAGIACPMGKLFGELKTKVDCETDLAFRKLVNEAGTDVAGALRDWIYLKVHGKTFTDLMRDAEQVNRHKLFGTGPDGVLTGGAR